MKKSIFISIIVSLALAACQEIIPVSTPEQLDTLSAMIEQECQTKTCLNDNNILWSADDQIMGYIRSHTASSSAHTKSAINNFICGR